MRVLGQIVGDLCLQSGVRDIHQGTVAQKLGEVCPIDRVVFYVGWVFAFFPDQLKPLGGCLREQGSAVHLQTAAREYFFGGQLLDRELLPDFGVCVPIYRAVYIAVLFFLIYLVASFPPAIALAMPDVFSMSSHSFLLCINVLSKSHDPDSAASVDHATIDRVFDSYLYY